MNTSTVIADIRTDSGVISIDARAHHCGYCEHVDDDGYCEIFEEDLEPEKEIDGYHLDWQRCGQCIASQVAAS